ncbi:MAG TPA: HAD-IB family hydrolase [Caulobacteraceae bacterium]|jgi:phosphatidylglycerophosphatase C|nr:HAD-IB family hydrolase [Caulobacteraceae bacterium]
MGDDAPGRQTGAVYRPLVAFDFDGTLTSRDSFTAFLEWLAGPAAWLTGLATLAPAAARYVLDRDRGRLKAAAARRFFGGWTRAALEHKAEAFAAARGRDLLRPDAVRAWRRWQGEGARLVIVTATPDVVVAPIARGLGADLLIGTQLAFDEAGRFTGAFEGENCRGPEKVRRLRAAFGDDVRLDAAYGDTDGDIEMLALADQAGMKVFNGRGSR